MFKESVGFMTNKLRVLIGSSRADNVQRICSRLKSGSDLVVTESWERFAFEESKNCYSIQITDLNLKDCFPFAIINNIQEKQSVSPIIILLEKISEYRLYREKTHPLIEILPIEITDDDRFVHVLMATQAKFDLLKKIL